MASTTTHKHYTQHWQAILLSSLVDGNAHLTATINHDDGKERMGTTTMMPMVEIMTHTQLISPMTLYSPIASLGDEHQYGNADLHKSSCGGGVALLGWTNGRMTLIYRSAAVTVQGLSTYTHHWKMRVQIKIGGK